MLMPQPTACIIVSIIMTATASDCSSFQASLPPSRHPYLERQLDFDQGGVDRDLNKIADSIINWEMNLSVELGLTNNEIHDIKAEHPINNALQRSVGIIATS